MFYHWAGMGQRLSSKALSKLMSSIKLYKTAVPWWNQWVEAEYVRYVARFSQEDADSRIAEYLDRSHLIGSKLT